MAYDLMLLADPGTERAAVLDILGSQRDIRADPTVANRYWLETPAGTAQINIGTKDPVESVHVEVESPTAPLLDSVFRRALELGDGLEMRLEDMQWGREVTPEDLAELPRYLGTLGAVAKNGSPPPQKPWWRPW